MAWDEIKFKISADMDFGNAINQVKAIKNGIGELKDSITDMPNVTKILDNSFEKSATVADELITNLSKLQDKNLNQNTRESIESKARTNLSELNALRTMQLGKTDYSAQIAKAWFGNLPKNVQRQFDTMAPQISAIIRTRLSSLSKNGNGIKAVTPGAIAKVLTGGSSTDTSKMDADLRRLVEKNHINQEGLFQLDNFIKYLIPAVSPMNRFGGYQKARYGTIRQGTRADLFSGINPVDLFPESYKETFRSKGQAFNVFDKSYQGKVLDTEYRRKVDDLLKSNPIAVKAALASGISRRDDRGILETKDEITRSDWESFRKALYNDLLVRVSGFKGNAINAYKATGKDKKTLMSRLTSSSSGQAMLAMEAIEAMEGNNAWINAAGIDTYKKLPSEGKRILNQHVVDKYSLFAPSAGLQFKDPRKVMISESHNTRLLGNNQWRNNQDVSDTISIVSLAGYDPKNKEHKAALEGLFSEKGTKIGNQTYVAQSIHGTGSDTVIRMIEKKAYDRVNAQERAWIESHPDEAVRGIRGEYWKGFENKEIERLIENGITSKDWGKHLEMLNKPWTPTQEVGINVDGKRFAVVNTRGFGDGGAWFSNNVIPHSGQFRGGLGLKGSTFVFEGNNVGALGRKAGLVDDQGRMMMEGPDGQLYDVSGYDGIIPLDVVKNKGILKDENGNYVSGDIASRRMTAMLQRYPMAYHADYDIEDRSSGHIGTQMASFMMLSPKVRARQIEMAMKVMNALDTESGQLKYVFGDQNDYLSKKVNEDTSLLASDEARARVDAKRASLIGNIISGQYTDFEDDNSIADLRAAANPIASILLAEEKRLEEARKNGNTDVVKGINTNGVIAKARYYLEQDAIKKKELNPDYIAPQYTDQQIRDMIILPKGKVVDFNRKDVKNVSIARSPTGFGNFFNAENIAEIAEPIYKGFGVSTKAGIYVSEQNTDQLQSMDFDADQVKAIYDQELAESIGETLKTMEYKKADVASKGIEFTPEELRSRAIQARSYTERSLSAPLGMGTGSAGIRVMQLDYSRPENRMLVEGARRAAGIYDIASTPKSGLEYVMEDEDPVWKLLGLGKEYTKFSNGLDTLFKFDEDMLDEKGNPITSHPDYYKASNGKDVNLRALRAMGIDEINLPSRYMANHLMAISDVGNLYRHGLVDTTLIDAAYEAMNTQLGYGDAGESTKKLMQAMRLMRVQFGTGERGFIANSEVENIQNLIDAADAEIELSASKYFDASSGKYIKDDKVYNSKNEFIEAQRKKYGVKTAKNAIGNMGMVEQDLIDSYGEDYIRENFINSTDQIKNEEQERQILLQQRESENKVKIHELQKKAEEEKKHKRSTRKTTEQKSIEKEIKNLQKQLGINDKTDLDEKEDFWKRSLFADQSTLEYVEDVHGTPDQIENLRDLISQDQAQLKGIEEYRKLLAKKDDLGKTPTERSLAEAYKEQAQITAEKEESSHLADLRLEFQGILNSAKEYNGSLYASRKGKENKIDDIGTLASRYWNRGFFQTNKEIQELDAFSERIENSGFKDETKQTMLTQISAIKERMTDNFIMDFADNAILSAKNVSESISNELNKEQKAVTPQKQKIDNYTKEINDLQSYIDLMQEKIDKNEINNTQKKAYEESINKTKEYIDTAEKGKKQLIEEYTKQNEKAGRKAVNGLYEKYGLRNKNALSTRVEVRKDEIQSIRDVINKQHEEGKYTDEEYNQISGQLDALEQKANKVSIATQDMMNKVGGVISNLAHRFTRQLFQRALQETKRFVKEFDSSMNEIQAITLKSDSEMQGIRSQTINKAIGLRTSVSNVATTEAALYRQGLSDAEVSSRTDSIIKFATVTKLNVAEATKIITTALQNDLVPSAEQAMDALVALGDSAATTAAEIGKGMQKAAASAKVAGVSYAELTALLTIGTSDTQLSGTQVGTALQTVFSRMRRLSISGYTADQNGEKTTASDAEAALKSVGVDLWDDKTIGKMRSAYDVLSDLSKVWQNLSDAQKNIVMNAMAGTRQTNVFSTLMEGMAEDGGATLDKYLGLAEGSEGITQTKYEIAMQSLAASMDTLKSSWDSVVESMVNGGSITGILDSVSGFLQMFANAGDIGQGMSLVAGGIVGIGVALASISSTNPAIKALSTIFGLAAGLVTAGGISYFANLFNPESEDERKARESQEAWSSIQKSYSYTKSDESSINKAITEVEKAGKAWKELDNETNTDNLVVALGNLGNAFPAVSDSVKEAIADLNNWTKAVDDAKEKADQFTKGNIENQIDKIVGYIDEYTPQNYNAAMKRFASQADLRNAVDYLNEGVKAQWQDYSVVTKYHKGNIGNFGDLDVDKLLQSDDSVSKAKALVYGYRNNEDFRRVVNSVITNEELLSDLSGKTSVNDLLKTEDFTSRAANALGLVVNKSKAVDPLSLEVLADTLGITKQELTGFNDTTGLSFQKKFYKLATNNSGVRSWIQENNPALYSQFFDKNGNPTSFFEDVVRNPSDSEAKAINQMYAALINEAKRGDVEYNTKRKQAALAFFNEDLSSRMPFEEMATEEYDSEFLKNLFIKSLGESGIVDEYGDYDKDALKAFVVDFLNGWKDGTGNALNEYVEKNADYSDFKYYIDKTDRNTWFNNYEDAIQYARRNKIDYNEIKGQNGESAYQSAAKTTDALLTTKDADKTARNLNTALDVIRNVSSLQELQSEYDKLGLGQELTNVLGSNDTLLGLFEMMRNDIISYSEFQDYASDLATGRTDRAGLVSSIYENLISGDLSVKDFRSLPAYSELYKTFSSIVGDSADAVLNAIEDGVQSADLTNAFNKSIIEQRIKEAMPASNYLSEAIAYATTMTTGTALQQQEYNANKTNSDIEFANYAAAINRYISGNAKPEDYATIAAMGDFSETALRNGVNKSAVRASYNTRVQARTDQLNAELQGALASLGIEGLTLDEYLAGVANREEDVYKFSELELQDEFNRLKQANLLLQGMETFDQFASWRNVKVGTRSVSYNVSKNNAVDQLLANYSVDENGNLVYAPRKEEYLSPEAVLRDEKGEQASTNRARYLLISDAIAQGRNINSFLSDKSYSEILQQDDTLRRMIVAGAGNDAVGNYVNRQLTGQQGTFQDNYGWVMNSLFGGTDTSKWNVEAIRTQWANAQNNPELLQFYNEILSSMAGGDIIKQIAQGGEGNLDEAIELYLKDYYTQLSNRYGSEFAQAIGSNQAILATGNASERFRLLSSFNQNITQGKNAQYYLNNWSSQSAGILSSYLGMTEEEVKQADRTELQDAINQSVKEEIIRQAESYGAKLERINVDTSSLSDVRSALEASLSSLSGDTKAFVENLIKQIDETGNVVGKASKSLDEVVQETQQQMQEGTYEYQALDFMRRNADMAYVRSKENGISTIDAFGRLAGWNQEWNSVIGSNQGLVAASSLYQNGTITGQQYQDFLGMQMSGAGKNADYYSMLAGAALGQGFQNGQFTSVEALQAGIANAKGNENLLNFYAELSSKYGEFLSQIESGDNAEDTLERLNEQWSQDKTNDLTKWLKNGSQAAQTLTALNKGGKDSAQAIASLRKEASQLNNAAVAIRSSAGKSGKQLSQNERSDLASVTGEDENLIKEMTKKQVEQLRQRAQESIDQSFVEDFGNTIAAQLNSLMAENPVDFEMAVQAHIGSDGQLDLSEISAIAADLKNEALAELASHAGTIGQLFVELKKEGLSETAIAKVIAGSVTGTGKRTGGGGGGGGGKSATDKLLEDQKRKVAEYEHQSKMLEIQEKKFDYTNDYSGWNNNISDQIAVQEQLRAQYAANIKEMTDMLAKVKEGSDDWKKLKDAIMQAEEAMASVDNTIVELNSKRLELLDQKYEKENRPNDYNMSMLQIRSEKFQTTGQVEGYIAAAQQMIETRRNQIKTNNDQIAELEAELKSFELDDHKNRDETIKKINDLKLDNEKLDADNAKETIAIQDAQINQIANDLYNQQRSLEHANDVSGVYGDIYKSEYSYGKYRDTLETIIANNALSKEQTDAAIEEERKYIESLPKDDISRQAGIERLYELEKKRAEYDSSDYYNRQDLEGTYIDELTQGYSDKSSVLEHEMKLLQEVEKEYLRDDDFTNYENILNEEARNTQQRLENEREALEGYLELQASGKITEGTQKWRDLEEIIRQSREDVSGLSNEAEDFFDKIQNARFENLHKNFSETDELAQHNLRMIQYEETRYKNRGELKNYGILLDKETSMQENRALRISEYIESLKEQLEAAKDNPELYKKITQEIYKYEEQLSSTNNTIEKNKKLLLENEEAIRKVYIAVEDLLDKEIRTRIQTQREMLKATVSIENTILDVIRKNEQEKWNLRKKTLDKQKQALNEEKALINERLNARKEALNEEEKYEELAELQRQLALISADTTRTKDAAELRKQIADIQKDISWDLASDQANASIQAIDDEIKAIDSYTSTYEEDLNEMLSDANNFTDDLNRIMGGSFDDFLEWMKAQDETYKLSTDEAKETSRQAWEDTWKTMKHELDTYWDDVDKYAKSREGFIEYMLESDKYQIASETGRESLEYQFGKMYDDYLASIKNDAEFDHNHEDAEENDKPVNDTNDLVHKVEELKEWTFDVNVVGLGDYLANFKPSNYDYNRKTDYDLNYDPYNNYAGIGKPKEEEKKNEVPGTSSSGETGGSGGAGDPNKNASSNGAVNAAVQGAINAALGSLYSQVDVLTGKNNPSQEDIDALKEKYTWLEGLSLDPTKKYTAEQLEALRSAHERLTDKDLEGISNLLNKYDTVSIPEPAFASSSALNQLVSTYSNNNNSGSFNLNFYGGIQVREEADIDKVATELEHKVAKTLIKQGQNNYFSLAR